MIAKGDYSESEEAKLHNEMWLLDGIYDHQFKYEVLAEIIVKYNRLGTKLTHYYLPEIYTQQDGIEYFD